MAGDWIPMRVDLAEDPSVISIAAELDIQEDTVVGKLHRLWSWSNRQLRSGDAPGVTASWLDRFLGVTGFSQAMANAGWLTITDHGISFPNWERHNGQPAKTRALTAIRNATLRLRKRDDAIVTKSSLEKRREEINPPKSPLGDFLGFKTWKDAKQSWTKSVQDRITPDRIAAAIAEAESWPEPDRIAAAQHAIAHGRTRLTRPKHAADNGRPREMDPGTKREMRRAAIVRDAKQRKITLTEAQINELIDKNTQP